MTKQISIRPPISSSIGSVGPTGRLDAIINIKDGEWICGGREALGDTSSKGKIYKTTNSGLSWSHISTISGSPDINAIERSVSGRIFALAGDGKIWKSDDNGATFDSHVVVSTSATDFLIRTYGLQVLTSATVLVADTAKAGGKIYRSTNDGNSFDAGTTIASGPLYRILDIGAAVVANDFAGNLHRCTDDGVTWASQKVSDAALYGMAAGNGKFIIGDALGNVFRSTNNALSLSYVAKLPGELDDIAWLSGDVFICSVFTGTREFFFTDNGGLTWWPLGCLGGGDWIDRMAAGKSGGDRCVIGVTLYGKSITFRKK